MVKQIKLCGNCIYCDIPEITGISRAECYHPESKYRTIAIDKRGCKYFDAKAKKQGGAA